MLYLLRLTIALVLLTVPAAADELEKSVQRVMKQARKNAAMMDIQLNKHQAEGMKAARESARVFNSPEYQEKLQCEQNRLKMELFTELGKGHDTDEPISTKLSQDEKIYLFLSSSIPEDTVQSYLKVVEKLKEPNFTLLMKGFVPGKRTEYLSRITKKDRNCTDKLDSKKPLFCERFKIPIRIKPSLYDKFEITAVPALVYEKGEKAWKISGAARLDYMLERINRETRSPGLNGLITLAQGGEYE